jgi:hypothetical protein
MPTTITPLVCRSALHRGAIRLVRPPGAELAAGEHRLPQVLLFALASAETPSASMLMVGR